MTHYLTLLSPENNPTITRINFSWGEDCGVWIDHPTPKSKVIAKMIVHEVQDKTRHNRRKMAKYFNWERIINKYVNMYNLTKEETET